MGATDQHLGTVDSDTSKRLQKDKKEDDTGDSQLKNGPQISQVSGPPDEKGVIDSSPDQPADLEALSTMPSARPVHTVFTKRQKHFIIFMASWGGFFSPLTANIYFPALNALAADLHVSSTLMNLTLTSYMIFQGLAPSCMGDLADMAGRRPAYIVGFVIYIGANIGLALQESYPALFVLRCVQSSGSSAMIALAYGVVADVALSSERGSYMGIANRMYLLSLINVSLEVERCMCAWAENMFFYSHRELLSNCQIIPFTPT